MDIGTYIEYFSRICQGFIWANRQFFDGWVFFRVSI